jgi:hypothetical protein
MEVEGTKPEAGQINLADGETILADGVIILAIPSTACESGATVRVKIPVPELFRIRPFAIG